MKISPETIAIFQNYAAINSGMQVKKGNSIKTISPNKTIFAEAQISETFDDFCVYDLSQFLGTLSLFADPEVDFHTDFLEISDGNSKVKYVFADPNTIVTVPDTELSVDSDIKLLLSKADFERVVKAAGVLSLPNVVFEYDGQNVRVKATDIKNSTSNEIAITLDDEALVTIPDHPFSMVFKMDNMKVISDDYVVTIDSKGIAEFNGNAVKYFVAAEKADSKFN